MIESTCGASTSSGHKIRDTLWNDTLWSDTTTVSGCNLEKRWNNLNKTNAGNNIYTLTNINDNKRASSMLLYHTKMGTPPV